MATYSDLLDKIKHFSHTNIEGVYSRPFLRHVIMKQHDAPKKQQFSLIYGDFNQLNDINQMYSPKTGDILIEKTYQEIQSILSRYFPVNSFSISRIGGDEFMILIDNAEKETISTCFQEIHDRLHSVSLSSLEHLYGEDEINVHIPTFLDFSYGIVHSDEQDFESIYDMYYEAEKKQAFYKMSSSKEFSDFETELASRADSRIGKFFKNFRYSKFLEFSNEYVKDLALASVDSVQKLLHDSDYLEEICQKSTELETLISLNSYSSLSREQSEEMYNYVTNPDSQAKYLKHFNTSELNSFLNILVRDPISGFYNKSYLDSFFLPQCKKQQPTFSTAIWIDITKMKDSNLKIGHTATDENLRQFSIQLLDELSSNILTTFPNKNFSVNANPIFSLGGGDYLMLLNDAVSKDIMDKILENAISGCEPLGLVYAMENIQGRNDLENVLDYLSKTCSDKKHKFKKQNIDFSDKDSIETLELFLAPIIRYYLSSNPHYPYDIEEQKKLISVIVNTIVAQSVKSNKDFEKHNLLEL